MKFLKLDTKGTLRSDLILAGFFFPFSPINSAASSSPSVTEQNEALERTPRKKTFFFFTGWRRITAWWFQPILKNITVSQNGPFPQIGVKILKLKPRPSSAGDQEWRCYTEYWGDDELPTKTMHYSLFNPFRCKCSGNFQGFPLCSLGG